MVYAKAMLAVAYPVIYFYYFFFFNFPLYRDIRGLTFVWTTYRNTDPIAEASSEDNKGHNMDKGRKEKNMPQQSPESNSRRYY